MADRIAGYVAIFAFGALVGMTLPASPREHVELHPVVNPYRVAESLGCGEVAKVCRAKQRSERISHGR